jgi:hypothetical protein
MREDVSNYIHLQQTLICWSATAVATAVSYPHSVSPVVSSEIAE